MQKSALLVFILLLTLGASCKRKEADAAGMPNPPFAGEAPAEAYVFQGEPGVYGGQLVLGAPNDMKSFNVVTATEVSTTDVLWYHVFRCLIDYRNGDPTPDYDPGLCTKWEASPDAKQWTFMLRKDVRWSDGAPFTADDVVFTYDTIRDERVDNSVRDVFNEGADENGKPIYPDIQKLDDHTVRFTLHQPNGAFLDNLFGNMWLVPKHKWEQAWRDGKLNEAMGLDTDPKEIVGLGPFRIKERAADQRIVLERNPYFWKVDKKGQRLPYLDRMIFVITPNFNTMTAKFEAGETDALDRIRAEDFALVKRMESATVRVQDIGVSTSTYWLTLNQNTGVNPQTGKPYLPLWKQQLFRNQKFRQAVSYAINREGLANTVFTGRAVPIYSIVTPGDKAWYADEIQKYPYNPELARQLLAELGLRDANGDNFLEDEDGHPVEVNILTNANNSQRVSTAAFIARNLQEIGIKSTSNPTDFNTLVTNMESRFNFDAIVLGWRPGVPPGPANVKNIVLSSAQNHTHFPNQKTPSTEWEARLDDLMKKIDETLDMAERKRMFAEVQRIWSEQLPEINLVAELEGIAYKNKFGNLFPTPLAPRLTWNAEEIYIKR
jgi:peptide/nickel transport system substrate-binding protein